MELILETPRPPRRGKTATSRYAPWLAELRNHPGEWARWPDKISAPGKVAALIKSGKFGSSPGEFEVTSRFDPGDGQHGYLFARYVGVPK